MAEPDGTLDRVQVVVQFANLPAYLLGCYGGSVSTPTFDELAGRGVIYDNCFAAGRLGAPAELRDDLHVIELHGVPTVGSVAFIECIGTLATDPEVADLLGTLAETAGRSSDPERLIQTFTNEAIGKMVDGSAIAAETLFDLELMTAERLVREADRQLAAICDELPPSEVDYVVIAREGWAPSSLANELHDTARHVPAIVCREADTAAPTRHIALTTPDSVLCDGQASDALLFSSDDGTAIRDDHGLYIDRSIDGMTVEEFFSKPDDRFNQRDIARQEPRRIDDYADRLRHLSRAAQ